MNLESDRDFPAVEIDCGPSHSERLPNPASGRRLKKADTIYTPKVGSPELEQVSGFFRFPSADRRVVIQTGTPGIVRRLPCDLGQRWQRIVGHVRPAGLVLGSQRRKDGASQEHACVDGRIFRSILCAFGSNQPADVFLLQMPEIDVTEVGDDTLSELSVPLRCGHGDRVLRSSSVVPNCSVKGKWLSGTMPRQESVLGARCDLFHLSELLCELLRFSASPFALADSPKLLLSPFHLEHAPYVASSLLLLIFCVPDV